MNGDEERGRQITVAAGDSSGGWTHCVDADEWAALTLEEQTWVITQAFVRHTPRDEAVERIERQYEVDGLIQKVTDPDLRRLIAHGWDVLPEIERKVLCALCARFIQVDDLPTGVLARTRMAFRKEDDGRDNVMPEILVQPGRTKDLRTILHEFIHAAYRHEVTCEWADKVTPEAPVRQAIEYHAHKMALRWCETSDETSR